MPAAEPWKCSIPKNEGLGIYVLYCRQAEQLRAGDSLDVLPPNGSFTPRDFSAAATYVAFAAGCGITPVLSVTRALLASGARRVIVLYGNSGSARAMCLEELLALKDRYLGTLALHFVMSREPQEAELYNGRIDAARVREFATRLFEPAAVREYLASKADFVGAIRLLVSSSSCSMNIERA